MRKYTPSGGSVLVKLWGEDDQIKAEVSDTGIGIPEEALPRVFCQDVLRVARKTFLEERTGAVVTPGIVRLGRLGINEFPDFLGYNLCYTKEDAAELIKRTLAKRPQTAFPSEVQVVLDGEHDRELVAGILEQAAV